MYGVFGNEGVGGGGGIRVSGGQWGFVSWGSGGEGGSSGQGGSGGGGGGRGMNGRKSYLESCVLLRQNRWVAVSGLATPRLSRPHLVDQHFAIAHFPLPLDTGQSIPRHHQPLATEPGGRE